MVSELSIPVLDQTTETVALTVWLKREGDLVQAGEAVCEIETAKATVEITAPASGRLRKILIQAGAQVPPHTVVALIAADGEPVPEVDPFYRTASAAAPAEPKAAAPMPKEPSPAAKIVVSPRARRLAEANKVDLARIEGSGPGGRILEEDVQRALAQPANARAAGSASARAERVSRSWPSIPHFFTRVTVDLAKLVAGKTTWPAGVTYTDFFILALGRTLPRHPDLNGHWQDDALVLAQEIRLGMVVEVEHGLVIPALADLRGRPLEEIAEARARLVSQARAGRLPAQALVEPTFTLSNIGAGAIDDFTALISPPQVALLTAGSVQIRPLVVDGQLQARPATTLTLCADHRAVDGRQAARFLEQLKAELEALG